MKSFKTLTKMTKGFLDDDEGRRLFELAKEASPLGPCLEIGSYCGKSTIYLGRGCLAKGSILFSIDHHRGSEEQQPGEEYHDPDLVDPDDSSRLDTFREFRKTLALAEIEEAVVPIVAKSEIAAKGWATPLGMVFIDGGHSFEAAVTDYSCWSRHIVPGGFLAVHDIFPDPSQGGQAPYYIYKAALATGHFEALPMVKTLGILQRINCGNIPEAVMKNGQHL